jgi:hypothetical protein
MMALAVCTGAALELDVLDGTGAIDVLDTGSALELDVLDGTDVLDTGSSLKLDGALELDGVLDFSLFVYTYAPALKKHDTKQAQRKTTAIIAIVPPSIYMYQVK